MIEIVGKHF